MPLNLIMTEAEWAALPEKLVDPFFQHVHGNNERACEIMRELGRENFWNLSGDLTQPESNRDNPWIWRVIKHRLIRFAVSWRLTQSETSCSEALRATDELINPANWHVEPLHGLSHADLRSADLWTNAAFALESLAPVLSEQQEQQLTRLIVEWGLPSYLAGVEKGDWWRYAEFNWGAALHGGAGVAALAVQDVAPDLAAQAINAAKRGLRFVIDNLPADGGWTEGLMYQTTTLSHLTEFVAALHRLTGDDLGLIQDPRLHDSFDSRLWMLGGDQRPINFSNINEHTDEWRLPAAYWWARQCGRPDWAGFEDAFPRPWQETGGIAFEVESFWWREAHQPSIPWKQPVGLWHGRELDWLSWKRGKAWLAFRSGFNGGNHNNLDLGQIIWGHGKIRILADPGYGATGTHQHSCITLKGFDQTIDATAKIIRAEEWRISGQWLLHVCCDLRQCYPHTLDRHRRHLLAVSDGTLVILDELCGSNARRIGAKGHLQLNAPARTTADSTLEIPDLGCRAQALTSAVFECQDASTNRDKTLYPVCYSPSFDQPEVLFAVSLSQGTEVSLEQANSEVMNFSIGPIQ